MSHEISFDVASQSLVLYNVMGGSIGFFLNLTLIIAIIKRTDFHNPNNILNLNLLISDTLQNLTSAVTNVLNLGQSTNNIPYLLCQIQGILLQTFTGVALLTVFCIALTRFSVVFLGYTPSLRTTYLTILGIWLSILIAPLSMVLGPLNLYDRLELTRWGGVCVPNWVSTKPMQFSFAVVSAVSVFMTPLVCAGLYLAVWRRLTHLRNMRKRRARPSTEKQASSSQNHQESVIVHHQSAPRWFRFNWNINSPDYNVNVESVILQRAVIISASFIVFWFPFAIGISLLVAVRIALSHSDCKQLALVIMVITGRLVPLWVEILVGFCYYTNSWANPVIVIQFDQIYRKAFLETLGRPEIQGNPESEDRGDTEEMTEPARMALRERDLAQTVIESHPGDSRNVPRLSTNHTLG